MTLKASKESSKEGNKELSELIEKVGWLPYNMMTIINSKGTETQHKLAAIKEVFDRTEGRAVAKLEVKTRQVNKVCIDNEGDEEVEV